MSTYRLNFNKELLEIGLVSVSDIIINICADYNNTVKLTNEDGMTRSFNINPNEKYIQGTGIKGFFKKYSTPDLFAEHTTGNEFNLISPKSFQQDSLVHEDIPDHRADAIIKELENLSASSDHWFKTYEFTKNFINTTSNENLQCLATLNRIEKYQYQINTVKKIFSQFRGRVLLCDEVGLGKTIEACMAMVEYVMRGLAKKILILTPASLVDQWYSETKMLFNQDFVRSDDYNFKKNKEKSWTENNKVIASISMAKRKENSEVILKQQYDLVIVDEAHHLKNTKSVAWQFVNSLNKKYIFLLTATPVQNTLEELYNLITLLKPGQLRTYNYFKRNFVGDKEGLVVKNPRRLKELLSNVMIRNKRSDVDVKLTKRFANTYKLSLLPEEQTIYDEISSFIKQKYSEDSSVLTKFVLKNLQERMGSSFHSLLESLESLVCNENLSISERGNLEHFLQQVAYITDDRQSNPKLLHLHNIIKEFDGKMIVFTKYKKTLETIAAFLNERNIKTAIFHGSMRRQEKENQMQYFKEEAAVLVSTEAGGEGHNMQFTNGMINFDMPWNPMAIEQRIGRIHRIGQEKDVYVYNLIAGATIEYYILEILDKKINMFELAIGEVDMILGDVEEKIDFGSMIMDAWVSSPDTQILEEKIELIGEKLIENKTRFEQIKAIDEKLFNDLAQGADEV